jgi:ribosomal protein S18 acetylase RimI-like enzyme
MENIRYSSPKESVEQDELPQHRFELVIDEEVIGAAELDYYSKPIPLYQLTDLYVEYEFKGKGYASKIMDQVETWLRNRKKPGVLTEAILEGDAAQGMYEKRGWKKVGEYGLHVYNWPEDVDLSVLNSYAQRYTAPEDREKN